MKTNYQLEMEKQISALERRETLLLHSCCGPCSTAVLERLTPHFDVALIFYNPNIRPLAEYEKRLFHQKRVLSEMFPQVELVESGWLSEDFERAATGLENEPEGGLRCTSCFSLRLEATALTAKKLGFDRFCSTLTVSPHKDAQRLNLIGQELEKKHGVKWLPSDFKKKDGYKRSIELSQALSLYRQEYCGCGLPGNLL